MGEFKELKRRHTEAPIVAVPRRMGSYTWDTDASEGQLGSLLLQEQPVRITRPVDCWSRSLNSAERSYGTTERECFEVWCASFFLCLYEEGTRFTVRTDHAALKWVLHMDGAHRRLARWRWRLVEVDNVAQTRQGASQHTADTMSRIPTSARDEGAILDAVPCLPLPNLSAAWQLPSETKWALVSPPDARGAP